MDSDLAAATCSSVPVMTLLASSDRALAALPTCSVTSPAGSLASPYKVTTASSAGKTDSIAQKATPAASNEMLSALIRDGVRERLPPTPRLDLGRGLRWLFPAVAMPGADVDEYLRPCRV